MKKAVAVKAFACFSLLCLSLPVHAGYSLNPLITFLDLAANKTSAEVSIQSEKGDAKIPMAIELQVKGREVDIGGSKVTYKDDNSAENFVVYPSQIVLLPGETQRVQVKWVGDSIPAKETAYGLIADQAPVKLGDEDQQRATAQGRLNVLTRYEGVIVVLPANPQPETVVDSAIAKIDSAGQPHLMLYIFNKGTGRQKLAGMKLRITPVDKNGQMDTKKSVAYVPVLTSQQTRQSLFPGYHRRFDLPWPSQAPVGRIRAIIGFGD
ncbi:MAG: hypothetical protein A2268_12615 [Candidatus Raymondbacteria bacterium RifOxyA12_full_50_37]|uniref:Pili assembly chaperone N-terminal domain-containing protein n=1 Tax=Candidatus Raymondbacteria bacterium RIFOXYD12_FULL_49_13 TaxID=1817890 RepID=A0A1F7FBH2_UNCRA|nr:MAG: hypothetical protein A2268_12615 [Candidatus Raymondbacteria bacterium RifOxyA12_full_50_37]OGJ91019.1 MAG: hypothetical protein A2248_00635 [Candidatus Raymondbacteria bacterium RIFOXYA2_FULL_49_16]OGJ97456.1 MAG: hypothetical protein A2453_10185 [Candidatus Raymondbacteria bacterium RIFOXYC2_FULL_50_21]OGJ99720.1 MAG: hypothetical protein A2350_08890 [Candidatus Raymondbacteria bacterium RifOxyB12_full_50_8]OGK03882.1 MAG: hypothetical protein A2519_00570 [Candidatus Raymondbacteria b